MPVVIVEMWEGRTVEQKKQLVEGITSVITKMGVPPSKFILSSRITPSTTGQLEESLPQTSFQRSRTL